MRIGISTSVIQRGRTGIAQHLFALLRAILAENSPHQFFLFVLEEDVPLFDFVGDRMQIVPVPERFRTPVKDILWHQLKLSRLVRKLELEVLHVPSYRRLLWSKPCGLVGTIHDLAPFRVSQKYDWKRMFYGRVIAARLARRLDEVIAISRNTLNDIVRFFKLPLERITLVYNGIEHERFFPGPREKARALTGQKFGLRQPFFLYVARLEHPAKNHVRLINAFEIFKSRSPSNWQVVLGGGNWSGAEAEEHTS